MSAEDRELLAQIGQLAGQINRHKNQQSGLSTPTSSHHPAQHHGAYPPTRGAYRGRGGYRVAKPPAHRHRTLVLNGSASSHKPDADPGAAPDASAASWVSKTDRHLQLINSAVYQKEAQARARAIEQTRLQRQQQKDQRERFKLFRHLNGTGTGARVTSANAQPPANYDVTVGDIRFRVTKNGSKLVKLPGDNNAPKATPKVATVGGVKFYRSKNGNLYRHGIVKAQRRSGAPVRKVNVPCQRFSTTGTCSKGPSCRYVHDPSKVAACKDFLQKGECANGDDCDLSHDLIAERTPTCVHYLKGNCSNPDCRYPHVKLAPGAPVCRPFGLYGYCDKGAGCPDRHAHECPDFSNTGICKNKRCKLLHRERASVLRKAHAARDAAAAAGDEDEDDLSSDDDDGDSVNSDDVDSDEVEEFMGEDDSLALEFANQKDFIQL